MLNDIFVKEKGTNVKYAKPKKQSKKENVLLDARDDDYH